jgi:transposase
MFSFKLELFWWLGLLSYLNTFFAIYILKHYKIVKNQNQKEAFMAILKTNQGSAVFPRRNSKLIKSYFLTQ